MNREEAIYEQDGHSVLILQQNYGAKFWAVLDGHWPNEGIAVCESHPGFHRTSEGARRCVDKYLAERSSQ